jgi:osmotically-inducible protein OsmY
MRRAEARGVALDAKGHMMKQIIAAMAIAAFFSGCDQRAATDKPAGEQAGNVPADNTEKNERDRNTNTLTPGDQGGSESDRTLTQQIRQDLVKNDALSMTGKNVKIITVDGVVTLRGPVKSPGEKTQIASIAQGVGGVKRVDNQLEVASN